MPLILSEEQTMLRDSADADGFSRGLWQKFAEMGFTGMLVPESLGGLGLGQVEAGVVMAQIGHQLCASPLLASSLVAVTALRQAGTAAQQQQWLPKLASGQIGRASCRERVCVPV